MIESDSDYSGDDFTDEVLELEAPEQLPPRTDARHSLPQIYKFFRMVDEVTPEWCGQFKKKSVEFEKVEQIVRMSTSEIVSLSWDASFDRRGINKYSLYDPLPRCPAVLDSRFVDTYPVSRFMCNCAIALNKRINALNLHSLRCSLCCSVLNNDEDFLHICSRGKRSCDIKMVEDSRYDSQETETHSVSSFDFAIALALPDKIGNSSLQLVNQLVDKCLRSGMIQSLSGWGVRQIALRIMNDLKSSLDPSMVSLAVEVMLKIIIGSCNLSLMMELFRWFFLCEHHGLGTTQVNGLSSVLSLLEHSHLYRARITFPFATESGALVHVKYFSSSTIIEACCVVPYRDSTALVLFTERGVFKMSMEPPYLLVHSNLETVVQNCCNAVVEDNYIVIQRKDSELIYVEKETLEKKGSEEGMSSCDTRSIYVGEGRSIIPHYAMNTTSPERYLRLSESNISGQTYLTHIEPLLLSESISIQFSILPIHCEAETSLSVCSICTGDHCILKVNVDVSPSTHTYTVRFLHGASVVAEAREGIHPAAQRWTTWSASLSSGGSSGHHASWKVYRNGVAQDCKCTSGVFEYFHAEGSTGFTISLLEGSFSGFISSLLVWSQERTIEYLQHCALSRGSMDLIGEKLFFGLWMSEGIGCTLHSMCKGLTWINNSGVLRWEVPPHSLPGAARDRLPWFPVDPNLYWCVIGNTEVAILEPNVTTWLNMDGAVIEQTSSALSPDSCCFLDRKMGKTVWLAKDAEKCLAVVFDELNKNQRSADAHERAAENFIQFLNKYRSRMSCSLEEAMLMIGNQLRTVACTSQSWIPDQKTLYFDTTLSAPMVTYLIEILTELSERNPYTEFDLILISISASLLLKQVKGNMKRYFSNDLIDAIVESKKRILRWSPDKSTLLCSLCADTQQTVLDLYETVIVECTSHQYQIARILASDSLEEVRRVLTHRSVTSMVRFMIQENDKGQLMQLLGKLKDSCQKEAGEILSGVSRERQWFRPSIPLLAALLCLLREHSIPQWHVVATALLDSLTKTIMKKFENFESRRREINGNEETMFELLQVTAIGTVVFPCMHILNGIAFDASIFNDIAKALESTHKRLQAWVSRASNIKSLLPGEAYTRISFSESHSITIPTGEVVNGPYMQELQLSHAKSITVEAELPLNESSQGGDKAKGSENKGNLEFSLLGTDLRRFMMTRTGPRTGTFPVGGTLFVRAAQPSLHAGQLIVVHAEVELVLRNNSWIADLQLAISKSILSLTDCMLSDLPPGYEVIERQSFLRGGLTAAGTNSLATSPTVSSLPCTTALEMELPTPIAADYCTLCTLAEGQECPLTSWWTAQYEMKKMAFGVQLERVMRWCCCALAWHLMTPPSVAVGSTVTPNPRGLSYLQQGLDTAMDIMKRRIIVLREALQQEKEESIIARARFLLTDVTPPHRSDASVAAHQQTEAPAVALQTSASVGSRDFSHSGHPAAQLRSRSYRNSYRIPESLSVRSSHTGRFRRTTATKIFKQTALHKKWTTESQITNFMVQGTLTTILSTSLPSPMASPTRAAEVTLGSASNVSTLKGIMHQKTQLAVTHTRAYHLLHDITAYYTHDEAMLQSIGTAYLKCRQKMYGISDRLTASPNIAAARSGFSSQAAPKEPGAALPRSRPYSFNHYIDTLIGCGMQKELEHQKTACFFVRRLLKAVSRLLSDPKSTSSRSSEPFPIMPCMTMCAILCHPWDSVDFSMLSPDDIFLFLAQLLSKSLNFRLFRLGQDASLRRAEEEGKGGLLDLCHRHYVLPNRILPLLETGVNVVDGDVQGIHVEMTSGHFSARHCWRLPKSSGGLDSPRTSSPTSGESSSGVPGPPTGSPPQRVGLEMGPDPGMACLVLPEPDVYYFEATIEVILLSSRIAVGVTPFAASTGSGKNDVREKDGVYFTSEGVVRFRHSASGQEETQDNCVFSEPWKAGDVIGCGIFRQSGGVFFTRNGEFLGVATRCCSTWSRCLPLLFLASPDGVSVVLVNFGVEKPFFFDIGTVHHSSRHHYVSPSTACDACFVTTQYLITTAYQNLASPEEHPSLTKDSVSRLLERSAAFLSDTILELIELMNTTLTAVLEKKQQVRHIIAEVILRFFHSVSSCIECFDVGEHVTWRTHDIIFQLCAVALCTSQVKSIQLAAAQCVGLMQEKLPDDRFTACVQTCRSARPEEMVREILQLSRARLVREGTPVTVPLWEGGVSVVRGKGSFVGATPLPATGRHVIGFRVRRWDGMPPSATHRDSRRGVALGGCYFLGLCRGQQRAFQKSEFSRSEEVFVLQDLDDRDRGPHLLLQCGSIPLNNYKRVFGQKDTVWVEWNADAGEISFYREQVPLGLGFANLHNVAGNLYPFAFLCNDDASCEIIPHEPVKDGPVENWSTSLRRSIAVHTLQKLHTSHVFATFISRLLQRSISRLDLSLEDCTTALAVLGGESSFHHCQHHTFGLVVVTCVDEVSQQAAVYLSSDEERQLFNVDRNTLTPTFVKTLVHVVGTPESERSALLLVDTLEMMMNDGSGCALLLKEEQACRRRIELLYGESIQTITSHNWIGVAMALQEEANKKETERQAYQEQRQQMREEHIRGEPTRSKSFSSWTMESSRNTPTSPSASPSCRSPVSPASLSLSISEKRMPIHPHYTANAIPFNPPVIVERSYSSPTLYVLPSSPSLCRTSAETLCSTIRGCVLTPPHGLSSNEPSKLVHFSVVVGQLAEEALIYIGVEAVRYPVTPSVLEMPAYMREARQLKNTWMVCNKDSTQTNHLLCCAKPGSIKNSSSKLLYQSGDTLLFTIDREEGTLACERLRIVGGEKQTEAFGILFRHLPKCTSATEDEAVGLMPIVVCGPETIVIFSGRDGSTLPPRQVFPPVNAFVGHDNSVRAAGSVGGLCCTSCSLRFIASSHRWYESCIRRDGRRVSLCKDCFHSWHFPLLPFAIKGGRVQKELPMPPFLTLQHTPKHLREGDAIEFYECPTANTWSAARSVNVFHLQLEHQAPAAPPSSSFFTCISSTTGGVAVSRSENALSISEPLVPLGTSVKLRVDWMVNFLHPSTAADGQPFDTLHSFQPLWCYNSDDPRGHSVGSQMTTSECSLKPNTMLLGASEISNNMSCLYCVLSFTTSAAVLNAAKGSYSGPASVFVGLTTRGLSGTAPSDRNYLEHLVEQHHAVGHWRELKNRFKEVSDEDSLKIPEVHEELYIMLDHRHRMMAVGESWEKLHSHPVLVSYEKVFDEENSKHVDASSSVLVEDSGSGGAPQGKPTSSSLRLVVLASVSCTIQTLSPGTAVYPDTGVQQAGSAVPPVAMGLIPEDFFAGQTPPFAAGRQSSTAGSLFFFLSDTVEHTEQLYPPGHCVWTFAETVKTRGGQLMEMGDAMTMLMVTGRRAGSAWSSSDEDKGNDDHPAQETMQRLQRLEVYRQGLLIAWSTLPSEQTAVSCFGRGRLAVWMRRRGLSARFISPPFSVPHIGRVVQTTCGGAVGVAETVMNNSVHRFVVRREDVRLCALSAVNIRSAVAPGTRILFYLPSASSDGWCVGRVKADGQKILAYKEERGGAAHMIQRDHVFLLDHQGPPPAAHDWGYQSLLPPPLPLVHCFEVGRRKYKDDPDVLSGYTGVMFDSFTTSPLHLTGIRVFTRVIGPHQVNVYFKLKSLVGTETREAEWLQLYSGLLSPSGTTSVSRRGLKHTTLYPIDLDFLTTPYVEFGTFALYIHTSLTGLSAYGKDSGCSEEFGKEMDTDGTLVIFVGKQTSSHQPFAGTNCTKGFRGSIRYQRRPFYPSPYLDHTYSGTATAQQETAATPDSPRHAGMLTPPLVPSSSPQALLSLKELEEENETVRLASRDPPHIDLCNQFSFTLEVLTRSLWLTSLKLPVVVLGDRKSASNSTSFRSYVITVFISSSSATGSIENTANGDWLLLWNTTVYPRKDFEMVDMERTKPIHLTKGNYTLFVSISTPDIFPPRPSREAHFLAARPADGHRVSNGCSVTLENFFGEVCVTLPLLVRQEEEEECRGGGGVFGERREMNTGSLHSTVTQTSNGIMFHLHADRHIILEGVYCTTLANFTAAQVKVFWKKGSMLGFERSASAWRLLSEQKMDLSEGKPFPVTASSASLPILREGETYAMFIQITGGSLAIQCSRSRFNDVGSAAETDGVLTIHVGTNCSSFDTSYSALCLLKGRIVYRSVSFQDDIAVFSLSRSYLLTRVLVALLSCVDSADGGLEDPSNGGPAMPQAKRRFLNALRRRLSKPLAQLILFPRPSIPHLQDAERSLWALLQNTSPREFTQKTVTISLGETAAQSEASGVRRRAMRNSSMSIIRFKPKDVALLVPPTAVLGNPTVVCVAEETYNPLSTLREQGDVFVRNATSSTAFKVRAKDLLPLTMCWKCRQPYAITKLCPVEGVPHCPPQNDVTRLQDMISNAIAQEHHLNSEKSEYCSRLLLNGRIQSIEEIRKDIATQSTLYDASARPSCTAVFSVPVEKLLSHQVVGTGTGSRCWPFYSRVQHLAIGGGLCVWLRVWAWEDDVEIMVLMRWSCVEAPPADKEGEMLEANVYVETSPPSSTDAKSDSTDPAILSPRTVFSFAFPRDGEHVKPVGRLWVPRNQCEVLQSNGEVRWCVEVRDMGSHNEQESLNHSAAKQTSTTTIREENEKEAALTSMMWETGRLEAELSAGLVTALKAMYFSHHQPCSWAFFCVEDEEEDPERGSKALDNAGFSCVNIFCEAGDAQVPLETVRGTLAVPSREVLLLHASPERLMILDTKDVVHVDIRVGAFASADVHSLRVGFALTAENKVLRVTLSDKPLPVTLSYHSWRFHAPLEELDNTDGESSKPSASGPYWEKFDPVKLLRKVGGSRQHIQQTSPGANAALGSTLPAPALRSAANTANGGPSPAVSFTMELHRADRPDGKPLDGGHFAGVALDSLVLREGERMSFRNIQNYKNSVWAVQDMQDADSMSHQLSLRPVPNTTDVCFLTGMKLHFIYYPLLGRLDLSRNNLLCQTVFNDIPLGSILRPFVLLDNETASAVLSEAAEEAFPVSSSGSVSVRSKCHSIGAALQVVPSLTESLIRTFPFQLVRQYFRVWERFLQTLPFEVVTALKDVWHLPQHHTAVNYHLSTCLGNAIKMGWFTAECSRLPLLSKERVKDGTAELPHTKEIEEMRSSLIRATASHPTVALATFPLSTTDISAAGTRFPLPLNSEVVPRWCMAQGNRHLQHLLTWPSCSRNKGGAVQRQTLFHLQRKGSSAYVLEYGDGVMPHPHVLSQDTVLCSAQLKGDLSAADSDHAVVVQGWYDKALSDGVERVSNDDVLLILRSVLCAVEHYHLHGKIHGRVCSENVLLSFAHNRVVRCALGHFYRPLPYTSDRSAESIVPPPPPLANTGSTAYGASRELFSEPAYDVWCCLYMMESCFPQVCRSAPHGRESAFQTSLHKEVWRALWEDFRDNRLSSSAMIMKYFTLLRMPSVVSYSGPPLSLETSPPATSKRPRAGAASPNGSSFGVVFDIVAATVDVRITKLSAQILHSSTTDGAGGPTSVGNSISARFFIKKGSYVGHERSESAWTLIDNVGLRCGPPTGSPTTLDIEHFDPIEIPAGERIAVLLHASGRCLSVLSESDGVRAEHGVVAHKNMDIGISVGKPIDENVFYGRVPERKCMLLGSVTYMPLTRTNGPRSRLAMSCLKEIKNTADLNASANSRTAASCSFPNSSGKTTPFVHIWNEEPDNTNQEQTSNDRLSLGIPLHRTRTKCLVLLSSGRMKWKRQEELEEVDDFTAKKASQKELDRLVNHHIQWHNKRVACSFNQIFWTKAKLEPLLFRYCRSHVYTVHPTVTGEAVALSEPIRVRSPCTVTLWSDSPTAFWSCRLVQTTSAEEFFAEKEKVRPQHSKVRSHCYHVPLPEIRVGQTPRIENFEEEKGSVVTFTIDVLSNTATFLDSGRCLHFHEGLADCPLRIAVRQESASSDHSCRILGFVTHQKPEMPLSYLNSARDVALTPSNGTLFFDQLPEPCNPDDETFQVAGKGFQPQLAAAVKRDHCAYLVPLQGDPVSIAVYELSSPTSSNVRSVCERVLTNFTSPPKWSVSDHVQSVVCDVRSRFSWRRRTLPTLVSDISSVDTVGSKIIYLGLFLVESVASAEEHRTVIPSTVKLHQLVFNHHRAHRLTFRVLSPQQHPVEFRLCETFAGPSSDDVPQTYPILYTNRFHSDSSALASLLDGEAMELTVVHLTINLFANVAYVHSSAGVYYELFRGEIVPSEMSLQCTFSCPGSSVELVCWETSDTNNNYFTAANSSVAYESFERFFPTLPFLSVTIPMHVGSLRCPPLAVGGVWDTNSQNVTSWRGMNYQMEHFITSYARFLAERILVTSDPPMHYSGNAKDLQMTKPPDEGDIPMLYQFVLYTSAFRTFDLMKDIVKSSLCHSVGLISHALFYLLQPRSRQELAGVETSITILRCFMEEQSTQYLLRTPLGPSLATIFLHTAVVHKGALRNAALLCAERLLSSVRVPLPSSPLLRGHLIPLAKAIGSLCRKNHMRCGLVQIGVTLISSLIDRYVVERPTEDPLGTEHENVPYALISAARLISRTLTSTPPRVLPAAFGEVCRSPRFVAKIFPIREDQQAKRLMGVIFSSRVQSLPDGAGDGVARQELNLSDCMTATLSGRRDGRMVIGWNVDRARTASDSCEMRHPSQPPHPLADEASQLEEMRHADPLQLLLPSVGFVIEKNGSVFLCSNGALGDKLDLEVDFGDVVQVSCSYEARVVVLKIKRSGKIMSRTRIEIDETCVPGFPFLMYWYGDVSCITTAPEISLRRIYDQTNRFPDLLDTPQAQSLHFYMELNKFSKKVSLGDPYVLHSPSAHERIPSEMASRPFALYLSAHDIAAFPHLSRFLKVSASESKIPAERLAPYLRRLHLFNHVVEQFSPLINLKQSSELLELFKVLRLLCSPTTTYIIQRSVLNPFIEKQTHSPVPVTIHTMIARPVAELSMPQTLLRTIFGQLYVQVHVHPHSVFLNNPLFIVKLSGFGSTDSGGPYREILSQLATEIHTPNPFFLGYQQNPLFINVAGPESPMAVMPNPSVQNNSQAPLMLEFFGRLLASCFRSSDVLAVQFPLLFWKLLQREETGVKDLICLDPRFVELIAPANLLQCTREEVEEQFPGCASKLERKTGMKCFPLTRDADARLLSQVIVEKEVGKYDEVMSYIQSGFDSVMPLYTLLAFQPEEVEEHICGKPELSAEDFLSQCVLSLDPEEEMRFQRFVKDISDEDRTLLLRFVTGQIRLPLLSSIKVHKLNGTDTLPTSMTCFYTLRIPLYTSDSVMRERVLYAIRQCSAIDADNVTRDEMILLA